LGGIAEIIETGKATKPLQMIEDALRQAGLEREQIECLAIGIGPGSYTGIRAAIAIAQGWQLASGETVRLAAISSAECIAAQARADDLSGTIGVVIDAQRDEFYLAKYQISLAEQRETAPLQLATKDQVCEFQRQGALVVGPEVTRWFPEGRIVFPRAATLGALASRRNDFVPGERLEPIYLRETRFVKAPPPRHIP
jgi:tRNA threonylcarbamoyl adenosine modification protein YeaZ